MRRGAVAFVPVKLIRGQEPVVKRHEGIAEDFGHDGRARDRITARIAVHDRPGRHLQRRGGQTVNEHQIRRGGKLMHGVLHRGQGGRENGTAVDLFRRDDAHPHVGVPENVGERPSALEGRQSFGIINPHRQPPAPEDDGRRDHRTGPGAAPGFINAGDARESGVSRALLRLSARRRLRLPKECRRAGEKQSLPPRCLQARLGSPQRRCASCRPWSASNRAGPA